MADCVPIAADLPFKQQVTEFAAHLARSLPSPSDTVAAKEFLKSFDDQLTPSEGQDDVSEEKKREIVTSLVAKVGELRGGLEAAKEFEAESSHLLLQYMISTNFETGSEEYSTLFKKVIEGVKRGGEIAVAAGRTTRVEAASRILNNTYNYLPSSSPLRSTALIALLSLLSTASDLAALTLTPASLLSSLSQWKLQSAEKVSFLKSASKIYESAGESSNALDLSLLSLQLAVEQETIERALALTLADESRFDLDVVLSVNGVREVVRGKWQELVGLFTEVEALEAVSKGQDWLQSNASWVEGISVSKFSTESVLRKIRLIALAALCSRSSTKQLQYSEVAAALAIPESQVEYWVIEAIRANLIQARLSQPTSLIRIQKATIPSTRKFGSEEWTLLEKRLKEWKKVVDDARVVVGEAEGLAASGPILHNQRRGQQQSGGGGGGQRERREEEVTA